MVLVTARPPAEHHAPVGPCGDLCDHLLPLIHATLQSCGLELLPTHEGYNADGFALDDVVRELEVYRDHHLVFEA